MSVSIVLLGLGVGTLVGASGVGAGALTTPILIGAGVPPATAIGTDLLFAAATKSNGALAHARMGHVDWRVVIMLGAGSCAAAVATLVWFAGGGLATHQALLRPMLACALLLTACVLLLPRRDAAAAELLTPARIAPFAIVAAGAALGALVATTSVGAGALGIAVLGIVAPRLPATQIVGTDIAHAVPLTLVAGTGYAVAGAVDWGLLGALLAGSLPGVWIGSRLTRAVPERWLRRALAIVLLVAAWRML